jgi:transcriptional regulator EpsA
MSSTGASYPGVQSIPARDAEGLLRLIEAVPGVRRRYQFFVWMQNHVDQLLPHAIALCGLYRRHLRELQFEVFHGIVIDDAALALLREGGSAATLQLCRRWVEQGGGPMALDLHELATGARGGDPEPWSALIAAGLSHLLVHGVARPEKPDEIESLFGFAHSGPPPTAARTYYLELLLPHLHSVYLRVQNTERELGAGARPRPPPAPESLVGTWPVTPRELQILHWVRQGMSNQQIGEQLGISALTVKNHVQKILRKMGASNRAHAVSLALGARLLPGSSGD